MRFFTKVPMAMSLLACLFVFGCSSADDPPPPNSEWGTMKWGESSWNNE